MEVRKTGRWNRCWSTGKRPGLLGSTQRIGPGQEFGCLFKSQLSVVRKRPERSLFPGKIKDDWQFYAFIGVIVKFAANYAAVNADIRNPRRSPRTAFAGDD